MRSKRDAMITPKGAFGLDGEPIKDPYEKGSVAATYGRTRSLMVIQQMSGNWHK